eukprot:CAMPEP_0180378218 /NCGR_PEP_ID=MMETSP0989-20121125/24610_1 /TAXON_ID=697907 /ORGANISM="non described non described, Strain CCMP2293" /LENGTH=63 /DNA_ID=CAMNT_0022377043 /DNA_START=245 /DNA_END=432 /DNA_ORIENTATION=-
MDRKNSSWPLALGALLSVQSTDHVHPKQHLIEHASLQMQTILYGKKAANLYTQAFVQNTQARA